MEISPTVATVTVGISRMCQMVVTVTVGTSPIFRMAGGVGATTQICQACLIWARWPRWGRRRVVRTVVVVVVVIQCLAFLCLPPTSVDRVSGGVYLGQGIRCCIGLYCGVDRFVMWC